MRDLLQRIAVVCWLGMVAGVLGRKLAKPLAQPSYYGQDFEHCAGNKGDGPGGGGYEVQEVGAGSAANNFYNHFAAGLNSNIFNANPAPQQQQQQQPLPPITTPDETAQIIALYTNGVFKNGVPKIKAPEHVFQKFHRRRRDARDSPEEYEEFVPVIGRDGVPLDTPEVRRAKEQHFLAHAIAKRMRDHPNAIYDEEKYVAPIVQFRLEYPDEHIPLIGTNGVPLETAEVISARKQHMAAHEMVRARMLDERAQEPQNANEDAQERVQERAQERVQERVQEDERPVNEEVKEDEYPYSYLRSRDDPKEFYYGFDAEDEDF